MFLPKKRVQHQSFTKGGREEETPGRKGGVAQILFAKESQKKRKRFLLMGGKKGPKRGTKKGGRTKIHVKSTG